MTLSDRIRTDLLALLDRLPAGSRFPTEAALCRQYSVSRMTVNRVVSELARAGRLHREPGRGSFVSEQPMGRRAITFLLPCADFLVLGSSYPLRQTAAGIAGIVRQQKFALEFLPVSPDNQADHLDFSALDHLGSQDKVVAFSCWFNELFPFLRERQCQTLLIDRQMRHHFPHFEDSESFSILDQNVDGAICRAISRLHEAGCRRIAIRTVLPQEYSPQVESYRQAMSRLGLPELIQFFSFDSSSMVSPVSRLSLEELRQLSEFQCDGLIYDAFDCLGIAGDSLHGLTGLPEDIKVVAFRFNPRHNLLNRQPDCLWMDYEQVGIQGIKLLLEGASSGVQGLEFSFLPGGESLEQGRQG